MDSFKFILTGVSGIDYTAIVKELIKQDDDLTVIQHCNTNPELANKFDGFVYYLDTNSLHLAYKNNSLITVTTNEYISDAVTIDDFYNNDICIMTPKQFNMLSDSFLNDNNIIVIWLDTKAHEHVSKAEMIELKFLQERLSNTKYLYFLDTDISEIVDTILKYIESDEDEQENIIYEYS